jgi:hypothetical protein
MLSREDAEKTNRPKLGEERSEPVAGVNLIYRVVERRFTICQLDILPYFIIFVYLCMACWDLDVLQGEM